MQAAILVISLLIGTMILSRLESYLARRKSWLPGAVIPLALALFLLWGIFFGYPFPQLVAAELPGSLAELKAMEITDLMGFFVFFMNVWMLVTTLEVFLRTRKTTRATMTSRFIPPTQDEEENP